MKSIVLILTLIFSLSLLTACVSHGQVPVDRFPILEYHLIGRPEGRWQRTPEDFRKDLEWLYRNGYHPFNFRDILTGFKGLPAEKKPVILTFDDSSSGQFRYLPDGKLDPDCAVGILQAFHDKHPDWPMRATFFVLIETNAADRNLFGQPEFAARKLRQLEGWGMEVGVHTYSHDRLDKISPAMARRSIERSVKTLTKYISQEIISISLPQGFYPKDMSVLKGFKLIAEVSGGMNPVKFDPLHIKRIQAIDPEWKKFFGRNN